MKKLPYFVVGLLVLGGFAAIGIGQEAGDLLETKESVVLSDLIIKEKDEYLTIDVEEATSVLMETGKPVLPVVTKVYTFPFGTKIEDVVVTFSDVETQTLPKKIQPASEPIPLLATESITQKTSTYVEDEEVYSSAELYPKQRYTIRKGVGLKDNEHVIYLNVHSYPIQYSPVEDTLYISKSINVDVKYQPTENPVVFNSVYDLLIIAPEKFSAKLQPLITHKNNILVPTKLETTENIYASYNGRDDPEEIKLFIKDAIDPDGLNWGVKYVLLVGGRKGQTFKWYVPDRPTHNNDGHEWEYSSDLYYADIWKLDAENNLVFEDWDSNGNNIFAEFKTWGGDKMDFYPDVYVGRIPCSYASDLDVVVDKIIKYESGPAGDWFKQAYVIAGDTFAPPQKGAKYNIFEGELETSVSAAWLQTAGFFVTKLYTSLGTFTGPPDVINAINGGAGFVHFAGHGNPAIWSTHPPNDANVWITGLSSDPLARGDDMRKLNNGDELPVVVVGGCHNSQFNTTMARIIPDWKACIKEKQKEFREQGKPFWRIKGLMKGTDRYWNNVFYRYEWAPKDWSSTFLFKKGGGCIAIIGNTGLGYGYVNEGWGQGLGGWIEPRFFDAYVNQSKVHVGEAHGQAISDYVTYIGRENQDQIDRKTLEEWVLLGDPSLQMGGVP